MGEESSTRNIFAGVVSCTICQYDYSATFVRAPPIDVPNVPFIDVLYA